MAYKYKNISYKQKRRGVYGKKNRIYVQILWEKGI